MKIRKFSIKPSRRTVKKVEKFFQLAVSWLIEKVLPQIILEVVLHWLGVK